MQTPHLASIDTQGRELLITVGGGSLGSPVVSMDTAAGGALLSPGSGGSLDPPLGLLDTPSRKQEGSPV